MKVWRPGGLRHEDAVQNHGCAVPGLRHGTHICESLVHRFYGHGAPENAHQYRPNTEVGSK